jgi:macrolide-specific efflux system membrane fusion protein
MKVLKTLKTWQIAVLVVLIAGIAGGGYGVYESVAGHGTATTSSSTRLVQVSYGNISNTISASGNLVFSSEADLSFSSSDTVTYVNVKEGDTVTKGQVLAGIDTSSLILAYSKAESSLLSAEYSLQQTEEDNNSTSNDIRSKALQVTSAEYAVEEAQSQLNGATLTAPFDGVVITVNIQAGESSGSGTAISIVDPSAMEVDAVVSETDVPNVKVGDQATVSVDALSDVEFTGVVTSLSLIGKTSSGVVSYPVVIKITVPSGVQPRSGMSATATIITEEATYVLVVPNKAITGASTTSPTVTVVANNVSATRSVTLGLVGDSYTEITSGLSYGDVVSYNASKTSTSSSSSSSGGFLSGGFPSGGFTGGGMMP